MNQITRDQIISELVCIFMDNRIDPAEIPELMKDSKESYELIRPIPAGRS